jgi:xanthine/CO dehydrogenase XdhC/CoxF family maturation factor
MDYALMEICRYFAAARPRGTPLVLATVLRTEGSTYRKRGASILIGADGSSSGMLSGGCLEADLRERAARVIRNNRAERVWFDTRDGDDPVFGLGLGCEGAMDVWLQPLTPAAGYGALHYMTRCLETERAGCIVTVVGGDARADELGRQVHSDETPGVATPGVATPGVATPGDDDALGAVLRSCLTGVATPSAALLRAVPFDGRSLEAFLAPVELPPSLLLCGAGPDAIPVYGFAAALGWRVTVYDHRPAYAERSFFPDATRVVLGRPGELGENLKPEQFDAAVIMSHHLPSDIEYLRLLCASPPRFIGVLGPPSRRQRLFAEVGDAASRIASRIHGPVGLDIGAGTPESIALAIVAQVHAVLAGRPGGAFG